MRRPEGYWEYDDRGNARYVSYRQGRDKGRHGRDDTWHYVLIVLALIVSRPLALLLIIAQVSGKWSGNKKIESAFWTGVDHLREAIGLRKKSTESTETAAESQEKKASKSRDYGLGSSRTFQWLGTVLLVVFGITLINVLGDCLKYARTLASTWERALPYLVLTVCGGALLRTGIQRKRKGKRFEKLFRVVGSRERVSLEALSRSTGYSPEDIKRDLEEMLERGFWPQGYVDVSQGCLIFGDASETLEEEIVEDQSTTEEILQRIRNTNEAIANPELSQKIYRIETLTGRILRLAEERPEKSSELRSFMSYYLPQTLKILERYAELEAQGIESSNISKAKSSIEAMMDKLVDGYEAQLDKLFAEDVIDISAEIQVLEQMLEQDGLTGERSMIF